MTASHDYDDIIGLPHHVSQNHPQMSMVSRAAQFSPFAALTGYEDAVRETARLTDHRAELDEGEIARINDTLVKLAARIADRPAAAVTYFVPDARKAGGAYVTMQDTVRKVDEYARVLTLTGGEAIPFDDIAFIMEIT